jgi:hypothetical protein
VVLNGPHKGDVIVLDDPLPVVFGRRAGVSLPDAALDAVHCQVFQAGGRWYLQDFATSTGTWLGDDRVEGARPLEPGRSFRIGETQIALLLPDQPPAAPAPRAATPAVAQAVAAALAPSAPPPAPAPRAAPPSRSAPAAGPPTDAAVKRSKRKRLLDQKTDILPIETPASGEDTDAAPRKRSGSRRHSDTVEMRAPLEPGDEPAPDASPPGADLAPHDSVGDYDILKELGQGAVGKIYKAYDRRRRRVVAVKILAPELAQDAQVVGRFLRGAQVGARLSHPNIATILGAGHTAGRIYVTMEYVEGLDLEAYAAAAGGRLQPKQAVAILGRVTDALVYAHARDVLHRSITPRNVLVGAGRTTKLVDLALAKRATLDGKQLAITTSGQVLSNSAYAAPELIFDAAKVDHRADIYGVGATLFFALSGRAPYEGDHVTVATRLQKGEHDDLRKLTKNLSKPLLKLVERCLRLDPAERYPAARDLREAFAELPESSVD